MRNRSPGTDAAFMELGFRGLLGEDAYLVLGRKETRSFINAWRFAANLDQEAEPWYCKDTPKEPIFFLHDSLMPK